MVDQITTPPPPQHVFVCLRDAKMARQALLSSCDLNRHGLCRDDSVTITKLGGKHSKTFCSFNVGAGGGKWNRSNTVICYFWRRFVIDTFQPASSDGLCWLSLYLWNQLLTCTWRWWWSTPFGDFWFCTVLFCWSCSKRCTVSFGGGNVEEF